MSSTTGYGSRLLAFVLSPLLFPQSRVVLSHLPSLAEAQGRWKGTVAGPRPLKLLVFGDSTVAGVGVDDQSHGLAASLAQRFADHYGRGIEWKAIARSGVDSGELLSYFLPRAEASSYDLVFVSIGVNDVLHLRRRRQFTDDLAEILRRLIAASPTATVFLSGIPRMERFDSLPDPLGTVLGARAYRLNAGAHEVLADYPRVVHTPPWPIATPGFFAVDRFHPSAIGYAAWARSAVRYWTA